MPGSLTDALDIWLICKACDLGIGIFLEKAHQVIFNIEQLLFEKYYSKVSKKRNPRFKLKEHFIYENRLRGKQKWIQCNKWNYSECMFHILKHFVWIFEIIDLIKDF